MSEPFKPTKQDIQSAAGKHVADVVAPGLKVLFCGINPGLYSGAVGHHFARPGNRFWPTLYASGFTRRQLSPFEERELLEDGCGITNLVPRATATAGELTTAELVEGARTLENLVRQISPRWVAVLGIGAYRGAFKRPKAKLGPQGYTLVGTPIWVLPNPSGLNAHYRLDDLANMFRELRMEVEK